MNDSDDPVAVEGLLRKHPWLRGLKESSGTNFTYSEHNIDNSWLAVGKPDHWVPIAWADGADLDWPCDGIAAKFDDGERMFWCHLTLMKMAEAIRRLNNT